MQDFEKLHSTFVSFLCFPIKLKLSFFLNVKYYKLLVEIFFKEKIEQNIFVCKCDIQESLNCDNNFVC